MIALQWDQRRRVYVRPNGSIVTPVELRELIENYIDSQKEEIDGEYNSLLSAGASAVLITAFFDFLRDKIKEMHGSSALVAYGGEDQMNPERWARVGEKIASEYGYANVFEQAVLESRRATDEIAALVANSAPEVEATVAELALTTPKGELPRALVSAVENAVQDRAIAEAVVGNAIEAPAWDAMIWGESGSRARMYADSVYGTHENSVKARESDAGVLSGRRVTEGDKNVCAGCEVAATPEYVPLDELLDIGDAECLSLCRCTIEFDYSGIEPLTIERGVYAPSFS